MIVSTSERIVCRLLIGLACLMTLQASPVHAATKLYGLAFQRTYAYVDPRLGTVSLFEEIGLIATPTGTFTYDDVSNQVTSFIINSRISVPGSVLDITSDVRSILDSNQGCDLRCFVNSMSGSDWNFSSSGGMSVEFSIPLNSSVTAPLYVGDPPFGGFSFGGIFTATAIPESATWALFLVGLGAIGISLRSVRRENEPGNYGDRPSVPLLSALSKQSL